MDRGEKSDDSGRRGGRRRSGGAVRLGEVAQRLVAEQISPRQSRFAAVADAWSGYRESAQSALASFGELTDRRYIDVDPKTIELVELPRAMSLEEFAQSYPSTVDVATIAIINGVDESTVLEKGSLVKRVEGGKLPQS